MRLIPFSSFLVHRTALSPIAPPENGGGITFASHTITRRIAAMMTLCLILFLNILNAPAQSFTPVPYNFPSLAEDATDVTVTGCAVIEPENYNSQSLTKQCLSANG